MGKEYDSGYVDGWNAAKGFLCDFCGYAATNMEMGDKYCADCHRAVMGRGVAERIKHLWHLPPETNSADGTPA